MAATATEYAKLSLSDLTAKLEDESAPKGDVASAEAVLHASAVLSDVREGDVAVHSDAPEFLADRISSCLAHRARNAAPEGSSRAGSMMAAKSPRGWK